MNFHITSRIASPIFLWWSLITKFTPHIFRLFRYIYMYVFALSMVIKWIKRTRVRLEANSHFKLRFKWIISLIMFVWASFRWQFLDKQISAEIARYLQKFGIKEIVWPTECQQTNLNLPCLACKMIRLSTKICYFKMGHHCYFENEFMA